MPVKQLRIDFSDMSGGKNSAFPKHALADNQVANTLNSVHEPLGASRAPGYKGEAATAQYANTSKGMFTYIKNDGTEVKIVVAGGIIYRDPDDGTAPVQIGTITGTGECYGINAGGKFWLVNGTSFVKIENDLSVYRVQIVAPATASMAAIAGSLPEGAYEVYAAYARVDSAGRFLYSLPFSLGTHTVGTSEGIRVTIPDSADPQVTHKVVFMTEADGAVPYYFGKVTNATAYIDIINQDDENSTILLSTVSESNQILPITPDAIYTFDDRIYVWDINTQTIYWSLKTDINPFDLERFLPENFRTLAHSINAVFSVGENLYFNHLGNGVSVATGGDMSSVIKRVQKDLWFLDCRTPEGKSNVCHHKGLAIGLTNDGFRFFNGTEFSEDLSFHIKPDIDTVYRGVSGTLPCAIVNRRRGKRTEYRFSYRNQSYSSPENNDQKVFNLDFYFDPVQSKKTWECWENGFHSMVIYNSSWYGIQNGVSDAQVVYEDRTADINCYDRNGNFNSTRFLKQWYIDSRTFIDDLDGIDVWGQVYALANGISNIAGNISLLDTNMSKFAFTVQTVQPTTAILPSESSGQGLPLPFILAPQYPVSSTDPMPFACKSNTVSIELSQVADDPDFFLYRLELPRVQQIKHNLT